MNGSQGLCRCDYVVLVAYLSAFYQRTCSLFGGFFHSRIACAPNTPILLCFVYTIESCPCPWPKSGKQSPSQRARITPGPPLPLLAPPWSFRPDFWMNCRPDLHVDLPPTSPSPSGYSKQTQWKAAKTQGGVLGIDWAHVYHGGGTSIRRCLPNPSPAAATAEAAPCPRRPFSYAWCSMSLDYVPVWQVGSGLSSPPGRLQSRTKARGGDYVAVHCRGLLHYAFLLVCVLYWGHARGTLAEGTKQVVIPGPWHVSIASLALAR